MEIITATYNPVLSFDESTGSYRDIGELECLDDRLSLVRPDMCVSIVKGGEDLGKSAGMRVYGEIVVPMVRCYCIVSGYNFVGRMNMEMYLWKSMPFTRSEPARC